MAAALMAATMRASAAGSKHRTSEASTRSRSAGPGRAPLVDLHGPEGHDVAQHRHAQTGPGAPWPGIRPPPGPPSRGPTPVRGRRGRRRSRTSACRPDRRGRGGAWSGPWSATRGAGDISSSHLGHSVLAISMATGEPRVRPWRMPPTRVTSSASKRMRGPRPKPRRRRASSPGDLGSTVIGSPAGRPSTITTRALPWDSPAVRNLKHGRQSTSGPCGPGTGPPCPGDPCRRTCRPVGAHTVWWNRAWATGLPHTIDHDGPGGQKGAEGDPGLAPRRRSPP